MITSARLIQATLFSLLMMTAPSPCSESATLALAYRDGFAIGVRIGSDFLKNPQLQELRLAATQFSSLSPEDCLKPASIQPKERQFRLNLPTASLNSRKNTASVLVAIPWCGMSNARIGFSVGGKARPPQPALLSKG